jgi:hypothetical protein
MPNLRPNLLCVLFFSFGAFNPLKASLEDCVLSGWVDNGVGNKQIHYVLHVAYLPDTPSTVKSIELNIEGRTIVFPTTAFGKWDNQGTSEGLSATGGSSKVDDFILAFYDCGSGVKSYSMFYHVIDGRLADWHLIPLGYSELREWKRVFDSQGRITYNGPCDRQGNPLPSTKKKS